MKNSQKPWQMESIPEKETAVPRAESGRLEEKELRAHEIAAVLPEALNLTHERNEDMTRALLPVLESWLRESIEKRPEIFVDSLHPIIGSVVRRSITENGRALLQTLNQSLEQSFSWQGLRWRIEALRTRRSFAEVVMLRSLVYRVEQVFLIRYGGLMLLHVSVPGFANKDSDMVAGMLSAIQDFARDSFKTGNDEGLDEFRIGDLQVWIASGRHAYLAAVIRGNPPRELRASMESTIENVHVLRGSALAKFDDDLTELESLRPELEACLRAQYRKEKASKGNYRGWLALATLSTLAIAVLVTGFQIERRWHDFVRRLDASPGIAITQAEMGWISRSRVAGLRDPGAVDPAALARAAGVNPNRVQFEWKEFLAFDDVSILRRFEKRFGQPPHAKLSLANGTLVISGAVPDGWIRRVRQEGTQSPGVTAINEREVRVTNDHSAGVPW